MSTEFAVTTEVGEKTIALRYWGGDERGTVVFWKDPVYMLLPEDLAVRPVGNSAQGVETIGDLKAINSQDINLTER